MKCHVIILTIYCLALMTGYILGRTGPKKKKISNARNSRYLKMTKTVPKPYQKQRTKKVRFQKPHPEIFQRWMQNFGDDLARAEPNNLNTGGQPPVFINESYLPWYPPGEILTGPKDWETPYDSLYYQPEYSRKMLYEPHRGATEDDYHNTRKAKNSLVNLKSPSSPPHKPVKIAKNSQHGERNNGRKSTTPKPDLTRKATTPKSKKLTTKPPRGIKKGGKGTVTKKRREVDELETLKTFYKEHCKKESQHSQLCKSVQDKISKLEGKTDGEGEKNEGVKPSLKACKPVRASTAKMCAREREMERNPQHNFAAENSVDVLVKLFNDLSCGDKLDSKECDIILNQISNSSA